ncbi:MAG: hypothetical protein ACREI2_10105 [Nitrospiraceae bacterium]
MPNTIDWERLISFVGYGPSCAAKTLFLGIEEKAHEGQEAKNLRARSLFADIEDLYEAHQTKLEPAGCFNPFGASGNPVQQWNTASRFALALRGDPDWGQASCWSEYWRQELGRRDGSTFLMECFPFPRKSRASGLPGAPPLSEKELWDKRRRFLSQHLSKFPPEIVIAYGAPTKDKVSDLFSIKTGDWRSVDKVEHAASVAINGRTRIAHVGFFGRGQFSFHDIPRIVEALRSL